MLWNQFNHVWTNRKVAKKGQHFRHLYRLTILGSTYHFDFTLSNIFLFSQSKLDDYEQEIRELQQKLSQNDDERGSLRERLNEVELEFRQAIDDHASTIASYEQQLQALVQERNALLEQQQQQVQPIDTSQISAEQPSDGSSDEQYVSVISFFSLLNECCLVL